MKLKRTEHAEASFDLTSMVDVTLLLLTFFVMGSQFEQAVRTPMNLPNQLGQMPVPDSQTSIVVSLRADGTLWLEDGNQISQKDFAELVRKALTVKMENKIRQVELIIRADRLAPSKHLSSLSADLARVGLRSWKLATVGAGGAGAIGGVEANVGTSTSGSGMGEGQ